MSERGLQLLQSISKLAAMSLQQEIPFAGDLAMPWLNIKFLFT
jgi:hypothetical protein